MSDNIENNLTDLLFPKTKPISVGIKYTLDNSNPQ